MSKYPSIFADGITDSLINRLNQLSADTLPKWGVMNAGQMVAHCNVAYDMETGAVPVNNNLLMRFMLKTFVKKSVVGEKPYPKNGRTAPVFIISDERNFDLEKEKLVNHIKRVAANGADYYEGKENVSFGPLTAHEWSTLYYKHLDHHLRQFGV